MGQRAAVARGVAKARDAVAVGKTVQVVGAKNGAGTGAVDIDLVAVLQAVRTVGNAAACRGTLVAQAVGVDVARSKRVTTAGAGLAAIGGTFVAVKNAVVATRGGANVVPADRAGAIFATGTCGARRATVGARAAAVDGEFVAVVLAIVAPGRLADAFGAHAGFTIGTAAAALGCGASVWARPPAVDVSFGLVEGTVGTGRGAPKVGALASPAIAVDGADGFRATRGARAAAIRVGLFAVVHAIAAARGLATPFGADLCFAVVRGPAAFALGAGEARAAAVHIAFGAVANPVGATWRRSATATVAVRRCAVSFGGAPGAELAGVAGAAAIDVGFPLVGEPVLATRCAASGGADGAAAVLRFAALGLEGTRRARPTAVHVALVAVGDAIDARNVAAALGAPLPGAIGVCLAARPGTAGFAGAAAVQVAFVSVGDAVAAGRSLAGPGAHSGGAIARVPALGALAAGFAGSAAVGVGFVAVAHAVAAFGGLADVAFADSAFAVGTGSAHHAATSGVAHPRESAALAGGLRVGEQGGDAAVAIAERPSANRGVAIAVCFAFRRRLHGRVGTAETQGRHGRHPEEPARQCPKRRHRNGNLGSNLKAVSLQNSVRVESQKRCETISSRSEVHCGVRPTDLKSMEIFQIPIPTQRSQRLSLSALCQGPHG